MQLTYLISADYARATGGWIYNERLLRELTTIGWRVNRRELPPGFPDPPPEARTAATLTLAAIPDGAIVLADQVCLSPLAADLAAQRSRLRLAMLMHHPQILEASRPPALAARLDAEERAALAAVQLVIATSRLTGRQLRDGYSVTPERLLIAEPGTDVFPAATGSGGPAVHILSVASVIPRKRHELIVAALAGLRDLDWRLTIVGNTDRAREHAAKLRALIAGSEIADRVTLVGELSGERLERLWDTADVFASASTHEGFGMAVAEAVARQIPVVTTRSGAVGDWLSPRAGLIVDADDAPSMRAALRAVIADATLRRQLREGAKAARADLPTWPETGAKVSRALTIAG